MKRKLLIILLAIVCVALLGACTSEAPETAIIGTWECLDETHVHNWECLLIFDEDGRFEDRDGDGGRFHIEGDSLILAFDDFAPITVNFTIHSNQLTLTEEGFHIVLTRQLS